MRESSVPLAPIGFVFCLQFRMQRIQYCRIAKVAVIVSRRQDGHPRHVQIDILFRPCGDFLQGSVPVWLPVFIPTGMVYDLKTAGLLPGKQLLNRRVLIQFSAVRHEQIQHGFSRF